MSLNPPPKDAKAGDNLPPPLDEHLRDKYAQLFERLTKWEKKAKKANLDPQTEDECLALDTLFADGRNLINDAATFHKKEKEEINKQGKMVDGVFNKGVRDVVADLNGPINEASGKRRAAIIEAQQAEQKKAAEKAEADANKLAEKAAKLDEQGKGHQADVTMRQAEATIEKAGELAAAASQSLTDASKTRVGGFSLSVKKKLICESINRETIDLEKLRPFLKTADIVAAVDAYLNMGNASLTGAVVKEKFGTNVR